MSEAKLAGVAMTLAGQEFIVPPLRLDQFLDLEEKIGRFQAEDCGQRERVEIVAAVVTVALGRNYPEMTVERAMQLLDVGNFLAAFNAALGRVPPEPAA